MQQVDRRWTVLTGEEQGDPTPVAAELLMVGRMRMVLALAVLLAVAIDAAAHRASGLLAWLCASAYLLHSVFLYLLDRQHGASRVGPGIFRFDVAWFALLVYATGGIDSMFFLFFFFAILAASFRFGRDEGVIITLASTIALVCVALLADPTPDPALILMRSTFVLALGYMSANWGEAKLETTRRLALLRRVGQVANPRFGVDHTVNCFLQHVLDHFQARACILVMQDETTGLHTVRSVREGAGARAHAEPLAGELAQRLLALRADQALAWHEPGVLQRLPGLAPKAQSDEPLLTDLADLLGARGFMTVPLQMRQSHGRVYLLLERRASSDELGFLARVTDLAFAVIDNLTLLDRLATEAAGEERKKLGLNLHDSSVQPWVGIQLALAAMKNKLGRQHPLLPDVDHLLSMAAEAVLDLRSLAGSMWNSPHSAEPLLMKALARRCAHAGRFYGLDVALDVRGHAAINDRLAAEVLHLVSEGLSNVCRHTQARQARVQLAFEDGMLQIEIDNEGQGEQAAAFVPKSICARASALGGEAHVCLHNHGHTTVRIRIPI